MVSQIKELLFQNKGTKQTAAKNIFWLTTSELVSRFIRGFVLIYAARVLGTASYGVFSYALGLASLFTIFADIGLIQILTREVSKRPEEKSAYFATTFWIKIILLLPAAALVVFVAPHFSKIEGARAIIPFMALLVIFDGLREFSLSYFRGIERMELQALVTVTTNIAITIAGFAILYFTASAKALAIVYALSAGIGAITAIVLLRDQFLNIFKNFQRKLVKAILRPAIPILFTSMLGAFMLNTDILMLGWFRTAEEIGLYSAGQKVIQILYTLPAILASATFPILSRAVGDRNHERVRNLTERMMSLVFLIAIPIVIGGFILATPFIQFIFGAQFLGTIPSFQILLFTLLISYPTMIISNYVLAHDKQQQMARAYGVAAFANIFLNLLLIPPFGIIGSSVATVIAQISTNGIIWHMAKKINNFYTMRYLKKIIVAAAIMGALNILMNNLEVQVMVNIGISAMLYFALLYIFKERLLVEAVDAIKKI